ncbi:HVA22-like protein i [Citrus sinensis]|uniref:HVA22-like protein i n=1 Tax=Citrus sinensis TaxID=2711 RepID=A0ACB8KXD8_CITSI|nr:HVA22-like protein i [Citrus sinensis]
MIGSFLTRGLVMVFGYAYPAYECYKTVEKNKPEIEQLRFWCQYWILVAVLTVCERVGDAFISWVPMYSEAKLAFFVYLWYPKTKGTTYVYDSFFRPYVARHENEIDQNLLELRTRAGDMATIYWQRVASYGQTRVFEVLQFIASQSTPRPRPAQPQQNARARQPSVPNRQPPTTTQPETEEPPSPESSMSSSQHQKETAEEVGPPQVPEGAPGKRIILQKANSTPSTSQRATSAVSVSQKTTSAASNSQKATSAASTPKPNAVTDITSQPTPTEAEGMQIDLISPPANENSDPPPKEIVMKETRVTRGRSMRNRAASNQKE